MPPAPGLAEARLLAVLKVLPAIQAFSLFDAIVLDWYFWPEVESWFLLAWTSAVVLHGVVWWAFAYGASRPSRKPSPGLDRWMLVHAASEALLFSVFFIAVFPHASPEKSVVLAAFVVGLLAAGSLSKMSLRSAAHLFIVVLTAGSSVGFFLSQIPSPWVAEVLLLGFAAALAVLVVGMSQVFDAGVQAEADLARQKTLVSDLLNDFSASASEGLWEVDRDGLLTFVSPRLAELLGGQPETLLGQPLAPESEWALTWDRTTAFRNLEIPIESSTGRRWWSLTGKPVKENGTITGWRGVAADVTEHRRRELEVLRVSQHDGLTGLLNRRTFRALIDDLFAEGSVPALHCLALIDMIDFKDVNETRGHAFGDALLVAVAQRLRSVIPERLVLARLDGDEFALEGAVSISTEDTLAQLRRLLDYLAEPYFIEGDRLESGFRMGVAFAPRDATTADQWLRCTDLALRTAKARGRNTIQVYEDTMMRSFLERSTLKEGLKGARDRGEFHLEYQPIVRLGTGEITGFEALARWVHPTQGRVSPAVFIPLSEETEVILELGLWILEEACRAAIVWPQPVEVSVNVSGVQLRSPGLANQVTDILSRTGLDPRRLILEVTESALVRNDPTLATTFSALKARGVRWALDDFGTGYSSLSYLQDFPFDKLKIDQSFVRPAASRAPSPALLGAIVSLARSLGLTTTAEGIEDAAHHELLQSLGCDQGQGYLFSRPVPLSGVAALLAVTPVP